MKQYKEVADKAHHELSPGEKARFGFCLGFLQGEQRAAKFVDVMGPMLG